MTDFEVYFPFPLERSVPGPALSTGDSVLGRSDPPADVPRDLTEAVVRYGDREAFHLTGFRVPGQMGCATDVCRILHYFDLQRWDAFRVVMLDAEGWERRDGPDAWYGWVLDLALTAGWQCPALEAAVQTRSET
jgi:hypothetical protein